jgi:uncharacterized membrane protein
MIRSHAARGPRVEKSGFRWRGTEVSRLEALSDAVFGFAITLLVVSLEVPTTFAELLDLLRGLPAFAASFAVLFLVWLNQYRFFRRYGLEDAATIWLNAVLLFVILFFVYPLKFVFQIVVVMMLGPAWFPTRHLHGDVVTAAQAPTMLELFGAGYVAVFAIFALLHLHALRVGETLELTEMERFETRDNVRESLLNVGVGALSIAVAAIGGPGWARAAGFTYWLVGPLMTVNGFASAAARKRLLARLAAAPPARAPDGDPTLAPAG